MLFNYLKKVLPTPASSPKHHRTSERLISLAKRKKSTPWTLRLPHYPVARLSKPGFRDVLRLSWLVGPLVYPVWSIHLLGQAFHLWLSSYCPIPAIAIVSEDHPGGASPSPYIEHYPPLRRHINAVTGRGRLKSSFVARRK
jgi:hypothetical protein